MPVLRAGRVRGAPSPAKSALPNLVWPWLLPQLNRFIPCCPLSYYSSTASSREKPNAKRVGGRTLLAAQIHDSQQGSDVVAYPHAPYNAGASQPKRGRVQFSDYHYSSSLNYNHAIIALANTPAFIKGASWQDYQQCSFLRLPQVLPDLRPGLDATSPAGLNAGSAKLQPSSTAA